MLAIDLTGPSHVLLHHIELDGRRGVLRKAAIHLADPERYSPSHQALRLSGRRRRRRRRRPRRRRNTRAPREERPYVFPERAPEKLNSAAGRKREEVAEVGGDPQLGALQGPAVYGHGAWIVVNHEAIGGVEIGVWRWRRTAITGCRPGWGI